MKKTRNYLRNGVILLSLIIYVSFNSGCSFAEEEREPPQQIMTISAPEREPAPQWIIDKYNDYIISMVGEDYFAEHIKLKTNQTMNAGKYGEKYQLFYVYTHDLKDKPNDVPHKVEYQFKLGIYSDGELKESRGVKYRGPNKPYRFLISKQEAIEIAIEFGLKRPFFKNNGSEAYIYYGAQGHNADFPVEDGTFGWEISSSYCTPGRRVEAVWIDVDNGDIITTKSIESTCKGEELDSTNESIQTDNISINDSIKEINYSEELKKRISDFNNRDSSIIQKIINWINSLFVKDNTSLK